MGVLGLTPFIQKHYPEVIKELPQRLRSLSGKTIVIDGTLITQRLHFAPMPCENRHVLGWYRLMRELKESGVGVICVFDGEERSHAKKRESERRRRLRQTDVARGAMEVERLRRLRRLTKLLKQHRSRPEPERDTSTQMLQPHELQRPRESLQHLMSDLYADQSPSNDPLDIKPTLTTLSPRENLPLSSSGTNDPQPRAVRNLELELTPRGEALLSPDLMAGPEKDAGPAIEPSVSSRDPEYKSEAEKLSRNSERPASEESLSSGSPKITNTLYQEGNLPPAAPRSDEDVEPSEYASKSTFVPVQSAAMVGPFAPESLVPSQGELRSLVNVEGHKAELETSQSPVESILDSVGNLELGPVANPVTDPFAMGSDIFRNLEVPVDIQTAYAAARSDDLSQDLLSLYRDYQESIPVFMSPIVDPPAEVPSEEAMESTRDQHLMSRHQVQLTLDEGVLWDSLAKSSLKDDSSIAENELESLSRRSDLIFKSYEKRNNPPTLKTYEESKLILQAMGIPCIDSVGPYEAEALAASLVHHGIADYVASEDTDVLVYEAPLLRNLTNRQGPLTLLSGTEVREVLQLDRASYVDFALLLGTDFSQRIKNLGPNRAIKLIRTHGRIEHVIAHEPKYIPRLPQDDYLAQVAVARLVFETLPPVPDLKLLQPSESDEEAVAAILDKYGVHREAMVNWDFSSALDGNYFDDNPAVA